MTFLYWEILILDNVPASCHPKLSVTVSPTPVFNMYCGNSSHYPTLSSSLTGSILKHGKPASYALVLHMCCGWYFKHSWGGLLWRLFFGTHRAVLFHLRWKLVFSCLLCLFRWNHMKLVIFDHFDKYSFVHLFSLNLWKPPPKLKLNFQNMSFMAI